MLPSRTGQDGQASDVSDSAGGPVPASVTTTVGDVVQALLGLLAWSLLVTIAVTGLAWFGVELWHDDGAIEGATIRLNDRTLPGFGGKSVPELPTACREPKLSLWNLP